MDIKGRITVYSILGCPHCMRAKNLLHEKQLPFTDISLDAFPQCRAWVRQRTGKSTVPQVFFNHIYVGGSEELHSLVENKEEFQKLVDEVQHNVAPPDAPSVPDPDTAVTGGGTFDFVCEPDDYSRLVQELRLSGIIKDQRRGLTMYKSSFTGGQLVDWLVKNKSIDRQSAIDMGTELITRTFSKTVSSDAPFQDDDTLYRLVEDDDDSALNAGPTSECKPRPAGEIGEDLRRLILKIYSAFLSADGKKVNYSGIGSSAEFQTYIGLTRELMRLDLTKTCREEKLAFFINIYNALVIHANVARGPPTNLWQRYKFFNTVRYVIGGNSYSLQDIENGVLRSNRKGVGMFTRPFGKNDPRMQVALEQAEPLIHFALVCGAKSCPPIKTYSANGIDEQLKLAAESFLEGEDAISIKGKDIHISQIFKWYREDFGKNNQEVLEFIHDHMTDGDKKSQLSSLLSLKSYRLSHIPYDWTTNTK